MADPIVSVIVPARDAERTLSRTLAAVCGQTVEGGFEVIVVDDGSTDRTEGVARAAPGVRVLSQSPLGPGEARNLGVAHATGELLAFCDADVFPARGWLEAGVRSLKTAELVQGKVVPEPAAPLGPFDRTIWVTQAAGLWETANLFVTRDLFERVGGFEQWLRPRSGKALAEDVWFGNLALRLGAQATFCEHALAYHAVFPRDWRSYAGERTRLRYFPAMVARMPELRRSFLYRRAFLTRRSARFDLAVCSGLAAAALRSWLPLAGALPYARVVRHDARRTVPAGPPAGAVAAADAAADVIGAAAMVYGSFRYRTAVL